MKSSSLIVPLFLVLLSLGAPFAAALNADSNPAADKFRADLKTAVMNRSITIPQVKELQENADTLKAVRAAQGTDKPVDLMTPFHAVSNMKAIMANVKSPDREVLQQDLKLMMANKSAQDVSATPTNPGQKLGKDIFQAVMHGNPTDSQVKQLQDSLNSLQELKNHQARPLESMRTLKKSKSDIAEVMNTGSFRPQDRQSVLDDLNNLGAQRGDNGARRRRG